MTTKRPKLSVEDFYAQFHNGDKPHFHSADHPTKEWWETHKTLPEHQMGPPVSYRQGGAVRQIRHVGHQ